MYNKEEDKFFCSLDAPNKEAITKHHEKAMGLSVTGVQKLKQLHEFYTKDMTYGLYW